MKVVEGEGIFGGRWEVREEKVRELIEKIEGGGKVGKEDEAKGEYLELTRSRVVDKVSGVLSSYTNSKLAEVGLSAYLAGEGDVEKVMGCIQDLAVFEKEVREGMSEGREEQSDDRILLQRTNKQPLLVASLVAA